MDIVSNNYMPGDPRLIDHIVYELKAQGIFDNFRKECIADVDTKPAYQNLRQRVEGSVVGFLRTQQWRPDMNKNQVREMLRKNISESGFLETGVERIVDQVVNPKINTIFLPQVENVVYKVLGIHKPSAFDELKSEKNLTSLDTTSRLNMSSNNLLPSDLEAVSPESEPQERKLDASNESQKLESSRIDDEESPPFEPLEESSSFMVQEDNSVDSHLSGFSGLASHDSNHSFEVANKITPMEISNQDSQFSKQSSDDHLSIVMSDETDTKMEPNEDSSQSKISKTTDSNSKSFDFMQDNPVSSDKSSQSPFKQDKNDMFKKIEDKPPKGDEKKSERRSSDKHRPRNDSKSESRDRKSEKDKKSDRDRKEHRDKSKYSSKDGKNRDKDKKDGKSKSESESKSEHKHEKDRDKSKNSSSRHSSSSNKDKSSSRKDSSDFKIKEKPKEPESKESEYKDGKTKESEHKDSKMKEPKSKDVKEKSEGSRSRDNSKSRSESKSHSSTKSKSDSKNHSKHNGKSKGDSADAATDKNSNKSVRKDEKSSRKDDKHHSRSDKYSSSKKDEKHDKDKKDPKKDIKKLSKDDHYGLKGKPSNRRSTDRDSSDGHSGTHSSSSSFAESSTSSQLQKTTQDGSAINSRSNSGDSGNSEQVDGVHNASIKNIQMSTSEIQESAITQITSMEQLRAVKLIKPKFASNIFEARRLMKIRKKLGKIEKQSQMGLLKTGVALKTPMSATAVNENVSDSILTCEIVTVPDEPDSSDINESLKRRPNILKKSLSSNSNLSQGLKFPPAKYYKNKNKAANRQKKASEHRQNASGKTRTVSERKADSEEENLAEVVEIATDDIISAPLQNSVISKESWDAVEARLLENVMKSDYHSYANSFEHLSEKEISIVQSPNDNGQTKSEDCLGLSQEMSLETQKYLEAVYMFMNQLEGNIDMKERLLNRPEQKTTPATAVDGLKRRLPKVAIVDVTGDSEIVISPSRGVKRRASDHPDLHNNNNKTSTRLEEDLLNEKLNHTISKINQSTKPHPPSKAKKAKVVDSAVNHLDTFNLPLSPAESDKSFTTATDKKSEKDDPKVKRNSNINRAVYNACSQRYSTDDLYKPRLQFSSSRRRAAKNRDTN